MAGIKINKKTIMVLVIALALGIGGLRYAAAQGAQGDQILRGSGEGGAASAALTETGGQGVSASGATAGAAGATAGASGAPEEENTPPLMVFVDIGGAVAEPGVIAMPAGSRIADAIEAAGGLSEDAETKEINQATRLADGDKVYIPTKEEAKRGDFPQGAGSGGAAAGTVSASGAAASGLVNINTADLAALDTLPGVGPVTAQRIIDFRSQNGPFPTIEALLNVSGIGPKTFEKMRSKITV